MNTFHLIERNSKTRAILATGVFTVCGILSWIFLVPEWHTALPLAVFFITILINTYFSIQLFSAITPEGDYAQTVCDIILIFLYILLAVSMSSSVHFVCITLLLFIVATTKYTFLLNIVPHPRLLKRKLLVDLSGVLLCTLTLGGILMGHATASIYAFTIAFIIGNILTFFVWPLYRLDTF